MNKLKLTAAICLAFAESVTCMMAQYPSIPPEVRQEVSIMMAGAEAHSDSAWAIALPIVQAEATQGRPYVPLAESPDQLIKTCIPAFPGAEGGGMYTPGGRGGKVLTVTNLNDDGEGSFRWACEQGGARIIVFNVSGIIYLKTPLTIRAPYLTIAGQTAPGNGVCIAGESVWVNTHDVIIRHLRMRRGETNVGRCDDCLGGHPIGNIMLDHLTCSWAVDETVSFYRYMYYPEDGSKARKMTTLNVTMQNCVIANALDTYNHGFGSIIGGDNCMYARNLWANNNGRNPKVGSGAFNEVNNVIYNWYNRSGDGRGYAFNIINNYYMPGPVTPVDKPIRYRVFRADAIGEAPHWLYVEGNVVEGNDSVTADNWNGGVQEDYSPEQLAFMRAAEPNPMPYVTITSAEEAYRHVMEDCGARFPKRDKVDKRLFRQMKTGKVYYNRKADKKEYYQFQYRRLPADSYHLGIITDIDQVGGYPKYYGHPYQDTDMDGMPDRWEKKYGLDPNNPSDAVKDCSGDGYTNIEKYINGIDPTRKIDWTDLDNNFDTLSARDGKLMK